MCTRRFRLGEHATRHSAAVSLIISFLPLRGVSSLVTRRTRHPPRPPTPPPAPLAARAPRVIRLVIRGRCRRIEHIFRGGQRRRSCRAVCMEAVGVAQIADRAPGCAFTRLGDGSSPRGVAAFPFSCLEYGSPSSPTPHVAEPPQPCASQETVWLPHVTLSKVKDHGPRSLFLPVVPALY